MKNVKTYYKSLNGNKIEYTERNKEKILKQKLKDLKKINSKILPGQKRYTLEELGGSDLPEITVNETGSRAVVKVSPRNKLTTFGVLPPIEQKVDGDLYITQNVNLLGMNNDDQREYLYNSYAEWMNQPFATQTDSFATAWDETAVAKANSFSSEHYIYGHTSGEAPNIERTLNVEPDPNNFEVYGHGINEKLLDYSFQYFVMNREVLVDDRHDGEPAYIVSKYHHTTFNNPVAGIGLSIGPASIQFSSGDAGTVTIVEYNYTYGDTN